MIISLTGAEEYEHRGTCPGHDSGQARGPQPAQQRVRLRHRAGPVALMQPILGRIEQHGHRPGGPAGPAGAGSPPVIGGPGGNGGTASPPVTGGPGGNGGTGSPPSEWGPGGL